MNRLPILTTCSILVCASALGQSAEAGRNFLGSLSGHLAEKAKFDFEDEGERTAIMIVDMKSPSDLPRIAEPWFLTFDARVHARPAMTPEDLAKAGLEELGKRYG